MKTCLTCREAKPREEYPNNQANRCNACWEYLSTRPCVRCGQPSGLCAKGDQPRKFCTREECQQAKREWLIQCGREARLAKAAAKTHHRCPMCAETKPWTTEHWSVAVRGGDGEPIRLDSHCRPCRAALQADYYRSRPDFRAQALKRAAAGRQRLMARRAADPEYAEWDAARRLEWERARRERARAGQPACELRGRPDTLAFPTLPARPLAAALIAEADKLEPLTEHDWHGTNRELVCARAGVSPRNLYAWATGERESVTFDVADRVLLEMSWMWWDVWPGDERVRRVFEGDDEQVAA